MPELQIPAVQRQLALNAARYREALKWVLQNRITTAQDNDRLWYATDGEASLRVPDHLMPLMTQMAKELTP